MLNRYLPFNFETVGVPSLSINSIIWYCWIAVTCYEMCCLSCLLVCVMFLVCLYVIFKSNVCSFYISAKVLDWLIKVLYSILLVWDKEFPPSDLNDFVRSSAEPRFWRIIQVRGYFSHTNTLLWRKLLESHRTDHKKGKTWKSALDRGNDRGLKLWISVDFSSRVSHYVCKKS